MVGVGQAILSESWGLGGRMELLWGRDSHVLDFWDPPLPQAGQGSPLSPFLTPLPRGDRGLYQ